jgi:hypothetical protein
MLGTGLLTGCATGVYQPPQAAQTQSFSREVNANFDKTWSAITNVAGSTFFSIKNFDKGSGLMTLDYDNMRGNVGAYVTCGIVAGGQTPLRTIHPDPKSAINYMTGHEITLSGTANIMARPASDKQTTVQVNSQYTLSIYQKYSNQRTLIGTWHFTSREPDTQMVDVNFRKTNVTCQPSYKLENDFLTEVGARLTQ